MTGGMAHDFNKLLTVVMGQAELLGEVIHDLATRGKLDAMVMAAKRGADLIDRLLEFARGQSLDPVAADLNAVILEARTLVEKVIAGNGVIQFTLDAKPATARVDIESLHATLLNLVPNSAQAANENGRVSVETDSIIFDENDCLNNPGLVPGEYVSAAVADNGEGTSRRCCTRFFSRSLRRKTREPASASARSSVSSSDPAGMSQLSPSRGREQW
ncbi:hypothetical protein N5A93_10180 [Roseovarius sp. EGI FJ00037]|nr:histidine kinase dimerization/phospho-acceptor domain-containing protein [Roseovarius sp. EGI FJ00037]MCZ0812597.1 hypothetical protein [Roseovarius sp. EGI FJ00037]